MSTEKQMREALRFLSEIHPGNMTPMAEENWKNATVLIKQALAAEPEYTPEATKTMEPSENAKRGV